MKQDLDRLMQEEKVDALWIRGAAHHNPSMVYFTGGVHVTGADLFILPGRKPIICFGPMEREEAAKTGFEMLGYANYPLEDFLPQAGGSNQVAVALRYKKILEDIGLTRGRVYVYGMFEFGPFYTHLRRINQYLPELEFAGDNEEAVIIKARATKEDYELDRIRRMGQITTRVVGNTLDLLTGHKVKNETLIKADGSPLTIGDVKRQINLWIAEYGAEAPEDTIFAIGRDAGVPHSSGTPSDPIKLGQSIVYDIFPCEMGGGYFYDFTRTWSLGYATDEVLKAHEQVKLVYDTVVGELVYGVNPARYQDRVCDLYEAMGHDTLRRNPRVEQGYVHSLGHGVGLDVHERPWFGRGKDPMNVLVEGSVFTIEPGLYYPEKGYGVRIEDTFFVRKDHGFERFVEFPYDLVIPMKG